jgi:hypothetical protein
MFYGPVSRMQGLETARWFVRAGCDLFSAASKHLPQKLAETGICCRPEPLASLRQLQCVEPPFGCLQLAARIQARYFGVSTEAGHPG